MAQPATERAIAEYTRGALLGLAAVSIWAGNISSAASACDRASRRGTSRRSASPWPEWSAATAGLAGTGPGAPRRARRCGACAGGRAPSHSGERGPPLRPRVACGCAVSRRHAADGCGTGGRSRDGNVHATKMVRLRGHRRRGPCDGLGKRRRDLHCPEHRPSAIYRRCPSPLPATQWRCVEGVSTGFTQLPSLPSAR